MDPSRSGGAFHPHFSPWLADPEQLQRTLVGHHQILQDFLDRPRDLVMHIADDLGIQNPGSGIERIHGRINSQFGDLA